MTFALATFMIALGVMFGGYWLMIVRPEQAERSTAVGRLREFKTESTTAGVVLAPERLSVFPVLDQLLQQRVDVTASIRRLVEESGVKLTIGAVVMMVLVAALAGAVGLWMLTGLWFAALGAGLVTGTLPIIYLRRKRATRLQTFEEQFPEAIDLISRALRAGHALTTGLGMVADEIPAPVGVEFRRLYDEQNFGMSLPEAMRSMARRVPVLDARFFVTAVLTQRESGGNLSEVLDNLASVMRQRFKLKRQIRVISAHGRISAWVLSLLPPALAGVLFLLSPNFMAPLWEDPLGVRLVLGAVVLQIIGTIIISRLVRIEY